MRGTVACLVAGLLAVTPALAESTLVYASNYDIVLRLFEKSGGTWFRVNPEEASFHAQLETPVEFNWAMAGIELDLALIVSVYRP